MIHGGTGKEVDHGRWDRGTVLTGASYALLAHPGRSLSAGRARSRRVSAYARRLVPADTRGVPGGLRPGLRIEGRPCLGQARAADPTHPPETDLLQLRPGF